MKFRRILLEGRQRLAGDGDEVLLLKQDRHTSRGPSPARRRGAASAATAAPEVGLVDELKRRDRPVDRLRPAITLASDQPREIDPRRQRTSRVRRRGLN